MESQLDSLAFFYNQERYNAGKGNIIFLGERDELLILLWKTREGLGRFTGFKGCEIPWQPLHGRLRKCVVERARGWRFPSIRETRSVLHEENMKRRMRKSRRLMKFICGVDECWDVRVRGKQFSVQNQ